MLPATSRALALLLPLALLDGCRGPAPEPPVAPASPAAAATDTAGPAAPSGPASPGLGRLADAIAAARPPAPVPAATAPADDLGDIDVLELRESAGVVWALVSAAGEGAELRPLTGDGVGESVGATLTPAALLPAPAGVVAASEGGVRWFRAGREPVVLAERGGRWGTAGEGGRIWWAACEEDGDCALGGVDVGDDAGPAVVVPGARFAVVTGLAWWRGRLVVAGRKRDPREGTPPTQAEIDAQARWVMAGGGALPPGARYAPGFLALVAPETGEAEVWPFPQHRPVAVAPTADGAALLVATEGTPEKGFTDGVLARVPAEDGPWTVLAAGLTFPEDLSVRGQRACFREMPRDRFAVTCVDLAGGAVTRPVDEAWNVLAFVDQGASVTWAVLTRGVHRRAFGR